MRLIAPAAAVLALALSGAAASGAQPCVLVTDELNDMGTGIDLGSGEQTYPSAGKLDIVSADVLAVGEQITAVIRVRDLTAMEPTSPAGVRFLFRMSFRERRARFELGAYRNLDGDRAEVQWVPWGDENSASNIGSEDLGGATVDFDEGKNEVRISAPLAALRKRVRFDRGTVLDDPMVWSMSWTGLGATQGGSGGDADNAWSRNHYRVGERACRVGRP
jgi:hypothetical protein